MASRSPRRRALRAAVGWLGGQALAGCAGSNAPLRAIAGASPKTAAEAASDASAARLPWPAQALAPGLWLLRGSGGEADARNGGRLGNAVLLAGPRGALVWDSGGAHAHGTAILQAARQLGAMPLRALLLSHARPEFVFGASALQDAGVPVLMNRPAAQLMAARCARCLTELQRSLGAAPLVGTRLVTPDRLLDLADGQVLAGDSPGADGAALLPDIGRPLRLLGFGHAAGPGDIALLDERSGWLLAGGLVHHAQVPDVQDGQLPQWLQALQRLQQLQQQGWLRGVVPAHGPAGEAPQLLGAMQRYLSQADARARQLAQQGVALSEVPDASALPEFADWDLADTVHRRNASVLFLQHERRLLQASP